jgi:hypothetical protein
MPDPQNPKTTDGPLQPKTDCHILTFRWGRFRASLGIGLCPQGCCAHVTLHTPSKTSKTRISRAGLLCLREWLRASLSRCDLIPTTVTTIQLRHPSIGLALRLDVHIIANSNPNP